MTGSVVFCRHASPDEPVVRAFAERLRVDAFDAWADSGQDLAARINDGPRALHGGLMFFGTHTPREVSALIYRAACGVAGDPIE